MICLNAESINEIATLLQSKKIAVLIGAGFSKNASPEFPLWGDLERVFLQELSPFCDSCKDKECKDKECKNKPESPEKNDPLVVAQCVVDSHGTHDFLDNILLTHIPDTKYKPSKLHKNILLLPWNDIFTTNYDTLLERATEMKPWKHDYFQIVTRQEDLLHSVNKKRIVKLHGTFSSKWSQTQPFIISTNDYRDYPEKYAFFINTVQQALIEKSLCLIGFSGDDKNFETWTGWLCKSLGTSSKPPTIYLLKVKKPSEKDSFAENVVHVDISSLGSVDISSVVPIGTAAYDDIHRQLCHEKLLDYLLCRTIPAAVRNWLNGQEINFDSKTKKNKRGLSLVHFAAKDGRTDVLEWLQSRGEDINTEDNDGQTPLFQAVICEREEAIDWICSQYPNAANAKDKEGKTPMHYAAHGKRRSRVFLKNWGANIDLPDKEGRTPMIAAAINGYVESMAWLKVAGADINTHDTHGKTALSYAEQYNQNDVISWLLDNGGTL